MSVVRHIHRDDFQALAVRGVMEGGGVVLHTLEDPDDCIPPGEWTCTRDYYHKGDYETYEIQVPERDRILFHIGNTHNDTRGCVLLGLERGTLDGNPAVLNSRAAFRTFMDLLQGVEMFTLVVTEQ